jgi:peptidoglycan/xylan/chitin deacetylase (PgdA/CDA1 family)
VGSHGRSHALLTNEAEPTRRDETRESRRILEDRLGAAIEHFAYPAGRFDPAAVASVAAAGYRFAYTTCAHRDPLRPLLTIPRRLLWERSCLDARGGFSPAVMSCLASGLFDVVSGCRHPHRLPPAAVPARLVSRWIPSSSRRSY